jgi:hypothetical protein
MRTLIENFISILILKYKFQILHFYKKTMLLSMFAHSRVWKVKNVEVQLYLGSILVCGFAPCLHCTGH